MLIDEKQVDITAVRRSICNQCPNKKVKFNMGVCGLCGCIIKFKTAVKASKCPINKW